MTMNPLSPPARPHIAVHSTHFASASTTDWDDAWDSGSDSEDRQATTVNSVKPPAGGSAPKHVPRSNSDSSSSTLAFSYTHLNPPNPGSYPQPKTIEEAASRSKAQNGWTIIRTSGDHQHSVDGTSKRSQDGRTPDADVEGDMILGELDTDNENRDQASVSTSTTHLSAQSKQMAAFVREDAEEIVNGSYTPTVLRSYLQIPSSASSDQILPMGLDNAQNGVIHLQQILDNPKSLLEGPRMKRQKSSCGSVPSVPTADTNSSRI